MHKSEHHHEISGLTIGQAFEDGHHDVVRIVAIDPDLHSVEAEDSIGTVLRDDIEHFTATHHAASEPLAG